MTLTRALLLAAGLALSPLGGGTARAQSAEVAGAIRQAGARHGVAVRFLECLARRESTFRPWVTSRHGTAGLYQFSRQTWRWMSRAAGWPPGASPYDPWAASDVAAWAVSRGMRGHWPPARWCGSHWA